MLHLWEPFIPLQDLANALANPNKGVTGRLNQVKSTVITGMQNAARIHLDKKIIREGWSQGISCHCIHLAAKCSKKWCNGIARYALLRWAVNQDDDVWLALRGVRHAQLCHGCGLSGDTFPGGVQESPLCEPCVQARGLTPLVNCPFGHQLKAALDSSYFSPSEETSIGRVLKKLTLPPFAKCSQMIFPAAERADVETIP